MGYRKDEELKKPLKKGLPLSLSLSPIAHLITLFKASMVIVDNELWKVLLVIKEGTKGAFYYHHDLTKIKKV